MDLSDLVGWGVQVPWRLGRAFSARLEPIRLEQVRHGSMAPMAPIRILFFQVAMTLRGRLRALKQNICELSCATKFKHCNIVSYPAY